MICIPVTAPTVDEALDQLEICRPLADVVELRIDFIRDVHIDRLLNSSTGRILVTNRKHDEGGHFIGDEHHRVDLLGEAVGSGADFIDIELSTGKTHIDRLVATIKKYEGRTKLIVSFHDFTGTPSRAELLNRANECIERGADIVKIATFARSVDDNLTVLNIINDMKRMNQRIIAFCMGDRGKISRVMAPYIGSYMSFAALNKGGESAPGQLTVDEMKEIFRILQ
jgi:3-dehydroquinate dehydratase type I